VCIADGVEPGDRLRRPGVSVPFQQRQHFFDRSGGGDPVYPEQLADQHRRSVEAQVEQGCHDSVGEFEFGYASAAWGVSPGACAPVVSAGFALLGPGVGEVSGQPCQGLVRHAGQRRVIGAGPVGHGDLVDGIDADVRASAAGAGFCCGYRV
jgi:hypothetical protein